MADNLRKWPSVTGDQLIDCARTYINTPWRHAQKVKGLGIDCAQLIAAVLQEVGVPVVDKLDYSKHDEFNTLITTIELYCNRLDDGVIVEKGDILIFRSLCQEKKIYNHVGFYTGKSFIHAYADPAYKRVIEERLSETWKSYVIYAYRYKCLSLENVGEVTL